MNTNKRIHWFLSVTAGVLIAGWGVAGVPGIVNAAPAIKNAADVKATASPVKALQKAVNASDVRLIKTVEQLPPDVRARFQETVQGMSDNKNKTAETHRVNMANPGASWNAGCMRMPGFPSRQLQFAGIAKKTCFVVFSTGGIALRQWVAVFDMKEQPGKLLGVTPVIPRCNDLAGLQKIVRSEAFQKAPNSTTISL